MTNTTGGFVRLLCFVIVASFGLPSARVFSQGAGFGPSLGVEPGTSGYPSTEYYAALALYRTAELDSAIDAFDIAISRTRRDINGHWIDAIPVYAMMGEVQYQLGDCEGAMQHFETALGIAIRYRGWLARPVWEELMRTNNVAISPKQYLWPEANAVRPLPLTRSLKYYSGEQLTEQRLALGGTIEELNIKSVDVVEILRGLAIASYRRRIILGPLTEGDQLASQALDATKYPKDLHLPLALTLLASMRSAERFGAHHDEKAITDAAANATFNGAVHPISPISGLSAASALAGTDKAGAVVPSCLVIANQAARLGQFEWIGEAMQLGAGCADENQAKLIQQASAIVAKSLFRESRLATLHCLIASADAAVTAGDLNSATARLAEARALAARRDVIQPRLEAYGAYVAARIATRQGVAAAAASPWEEPIGQIVNFATKSRTRRRALVSIPRLYQLQRVRLALGRKSVGSSADALLARYCEDPSIDVWRRDPVDAIAGQMANRDALRLSRLRIAVARESAPDVITRTEDLQIGRLRDQLPLGGRVHAIRTLARLDDKLLDPKMVALRNKAAKPMRELRAAAEAKLPGEADASLPRVLDLERKAWAIALDRHAAPHVLPRPLDQKLPTATLPPNVALLTFVEDGNTFYVTLATKKDSDFWAINGSKRIGTEVGKLLRGIGATPTRGPRLPKDDAWRDSAVAIRDRLFLADTGKLLSGRLAGIEHLVIVPDTLLWYLPFEILPVDEPDSEFLGDAIKISYAGSPGLAMFPTAMPPVTAKVGLTTGNFFAPREPEANTAIIRSIVESVDESSFLPLPSAASIATSQCGQKCGHLIVGEPTTPNPAAFYETRLARYEASVPRGALGAWLGFPKEKPATIFLPGYRSNIDTTEAPSGREIFQMIASLQLAGVRDVVISRWALGGESTATMMREYLQEVPFIGADGAFMRAKTVLRRSELSPMGEPTLAGADQERETLTGDEPFFWSTYLHAAPIPQPES